MFGTNVSRYGEPGVVRPTSKGRPMSSQALLGEQRAKESKRFPVVVLAGAAAVAMLPGVAWATQRISHCVRRLRLRSLNLK